MNKICFGIALAALLFLTASASMAQDSFDACRLILLTYDPATGSLTFETNIGPYFDFISIGSNKLPIYVTAYDGAQKREIEKTAYVTVTGERVRNKQKMVVYIGLNITEVQISSQVGKSAKWTIAEKPLPLNRLAKANAGGHKNFYVLKNYQPCPEAICAKTITVNADDYKLLNKNDYDDTDRLSLPTTYSTGIEQK